MKLKHLTALKNGSIKFRRRFPIDVYQASGKQFFAITMKNSDAATVNFHKEYEALMREWQSLVDTYRARKGSEVRSLEERYRDALRQRTEFLTGVTGPEESEARDLMLEQMGPTLALWSVAF